MRHPIEVTNKPGQLRWGRIHNRLEDPTAKGKIRPVVLIEKRGNGWQVMGLTTKSWYDAGGSRMPIPNPQAVGLSQPGYLWGGRLPTIPEADVLGEIGWVDAPLIDAITGLASVGASAAIDLIVAASAHHGVQVQ